MGIINLSVSVKFDFSIILMGFHFKIGIVHFTPSLADRLYLLF